MRKPIIFKDNCDDELPWACCYEDDESNVEWTEGRFSIGFGQTPIEAYEDWDKKRLQRYLQRVLKSNEWFMDSGVGKPLDEVLDYIGSLLPMTAGECKAKYLGEK